MPADRYTSAIPPTARETALEPLSPAAPAPTRSWQFNLYALTVAQFFIFVAFGFVNPFQALYIKDDLGIDDLSSVALWSGAVSFIQALVLSIFSPIWGSVSDQFGRRVMVMRVGFGGGLIIGLMALCQNVYQFAGLRLVQGVFTGAIAPGTALAVAIVPKARLGFALGILQMSLLAGNAVGPLIGGLVVDALGYRPGFVVGGAMMWISGFVVLFFVTEHFVRPERATGSHVGVRAMAHDLAAIASDRQMLLMMLVLFSVNFGFSTVFPVLPLFVEELDPTVSGATTTGIILMVTGVVSSIAVVFLGRLSDRVGHRLLLIVMALGAGLTYIPQALVQSTTSLLVLRGLLGLFDGGIIPTANALIGARASGRAGGAAYGLIYGASGLGFAIGPLFGGILAATFGLRSVFVSTAVVLLAIGLLLPFTLERESHPAEPAQSEAT